MLAVGAFEPLERRGVTPVSRPNAHPIHIPYLSKSLVGERISLGRHMGETPTTVLVRQQLIAVPPTRYHPILGRFLCTYGVRSHMYWYCRPTHTAGSLPIFCLLVPIK